MQLISFMHEYKHGIFSSLMYLFFSSAALGSAYDDQLESAVAQCESVDEDAYQTGLAFNPDGYRSYYERSQCFQRLAIKFRHDLYCSLVKERSSYVFSSWGYSEDNCNKLVTQGKRADNSTLGRVKEAYNSNKVRLLEFEIEVNGNGRDYDIIPKFSAGYSHAYTLEFKILNSKNEAQDAVLDSSGFYLGRADENIRIYVPQERILENFPLFNKGNSYLVRATLVLSVGTGYQNGMWSDKFIDRVFPAHERSQHLDQEFVF